MWRSAALKGNRCSPTEYLFVAFLSKQNEALATLVGLDRGRRATAKERAAVLGSLRRLEESDEGILPEFPRNLKECLDGTWDLVYSSNFRPVPLLVPDSSVIQQVVDSERLIVENIIRVEQQAPLPSGEIRLKASFRSLNHNSLKLTLLSSKITLGERLSPLTLPIPFSPSGNFSTTYVSDRLRISRGDRDEIRLLLRHPETAGRHPKSR